jgi:glutathione synthase/RimK-type ligase-like ATP-grasp enzyme
MILIFGSKSEPNIPKMIDILNDRNEPWSRINGEDWPANVTTDLEIGVSNSLSVGKCHKKKSVIDLSAIKSVWNRRRGDIDPPHDLRHGHRLFVKDEVVATLNGLETLTGKARWMNNHWADVSSNNALMQFQSAKKANLRIPKTLITQDEESAKRFIAVNGSGTIVKQIGKNALFKYEISPIYTSRIENKHHQHFHTLENCPTLLQERIHCEVELRITVVGENIFCAATEPNAHSENTPDIRQNNGLATTSFYPWCLPESVKRSILMLMRQLGLVFGAIDMMLSRDGEYVFIELNNAGQWGWIENQTGLPITEAIANWLIGDN